MKPEEKAKELLSKMYSPIFDIDNGVDTSKDQDRFNAAKKCVIIAIDEILSTYIDMDESVVFWTLVKIEVNSL